MCEAVAPAVPRGLGADQDLPEKGKAKTDCLLADAGGDTTLVVSLVKPESGSVEKALKGVCEDYLGSPQDSDEEQCTKTGPVELEGAPAELNRRSAWTVPRVSCG